MCQRRRRWIRPRRLRRRRSWMPQRARRRWRRRGRRLRSRRRRRRRRGAACRLGRCQRLSRGRFGRRGGGGVRGGSERYGTGRVRHCPCCSRGGAAPPPRGGRGGACVVVRGRSARPRPVELRLARALARAPRRTASLRPRQTRVPPSCSAAAAAPRPPGPHARGAARISRIGGNNVKGGGVRGRRRAHAPPARARGVRREPRQLRQLRQREAQRRGGPPLRLPLGLARRDRGVGSGGSEVAPIDGEAMLLGQARRAPFDPCDPPPMV